MKKPTPALLVAVTALAAVPLGCNRGAEDTSATTTTTTTTTTGATGAAGTTGANPRAGGPAGMTGPAGMGAPTMMTGGKLGARGPGAATPAGGMPGAQTEQRPTQVASVPPISVRRDPFKIDWTKPPPPVYVFNEVPPIRLASADVVVAPARPVEVREVPSRRVSGIMSGEGVYAILEGLGEPEIVKPGSTTRDGYRVVAINANSVRLQKVQIAPNGAKLILTQTVPLTDVPAGAQPAVLRGQGGFPGGMPGMPGLPGQPGRPGRGGGTPGGRFDEEF